MKLKISLKSQSGLPGSHSYSNEINAENFKEIALILKDLSNYGIPIDKAIKEYLKETKTDWDIIIGE